MESKDKIEKVIREAFENYEEPVSQGMWDKISQQLPQGSPSQGGHDGGASSSAGSSTTGNVITASKGLSAGIWGGAAIVAVTATTLYFVNSGDERSGHTTEQKAASEITIEEPVTELQENTVHFEDVQATGISEESSENADNRQPSSGNPESKEVEKVMASNDRSSIIKNTKDQTSINSTSKQGDPDPVRAGKNTGNGPGNEADKPQESLSGKPAVTQSETDRSGDTPEEVTKPATVRYELFASPAEGVAPLEVTLTLKAYSGEVTWDFGDGASGFGGPSISHQYEIPGTYTAWAKFTDESGVQHAEPAIIKVEADDFLKNFIPNVFTPNGDGTNDVFTIRSEQLTECEVTIYDRRGRQVARFLDPEIGWDGTLEGGSLAPEGTYFYVIIAKGKEGQAHNYKGTLKLIR